MLPIRQTILALPQLGGTSKAVLIEVCQLAEAAGGWCRATNPYLATALGSTERTITRQLTTLEARGLLQAPGAGKARRLAPTPALRACYLAETEAARATALATLNLANLDTFDAANLDTNGAQPRQSGEVGEVQTASNLDTFGAEPRHNGSANLDTIGAQPRHNGSRVLGDQQDHQLDQQHPLGAGERWELQKKIGDLQAEVQHLRAQLARKAPPVAGRPPAGYRDFEGAWPDNLTPPFEPPAFRAAWATYAHYAAEIGKPFGPVSEQQALSELGRFAAGDMQRALRILAHNITQRYRTLTNDDGTQSARKPSGPSSGSPGTGRVSALPAASYGRNRPAPAPAADAPAGVAA